MLKNIFNTKLFYLLTFYILVLFPLYSNEKLSSKMDKQDLYNQQKVSFKVKKEFDVLYPLNKKIFYLYKGKERINFQQFITMSNDSVLIKNQKKINKIKIAGFTTAGVMGGAAIAFLIPSIVFIVNMTHYNPIDIGYILSGVSMVGLSLLSVLILLVDLTVTFSLLHKYRFNEYAIKQAIDRYNEKLREKLGIIPDFSFNNKDIIIGARVRL